MLEGSGAFSMTSAAQRAAMSSYKIGTFFRMSSLCCSESFITSETHGFGLALSLALPGLEIPVCTPPVHAMETDTRS